MSRISDYVVLYQNNAIGAPDINNGNRYLKWNIPPTYYSNARGSVCTVTLIDIKCTLANVAYSYLTLYYDNGGDNIIDSSKAQSFLGTYSEGYQVREIPLSILTQAAPTTITMSVGGNNNSPLLAAGTVTDAVFVLRFDYYNVEETGKILHKGYTPQLLKKIFS